VEGEAVKLLRGVEGGGSLVFGSTSSSSISIMVTGGGRVLANRGSGAGLPSTVSIQGGWVVRGVDLLLGETSVVDWVA